MPKYQLDTVGEVRTVDELRAYVGRSSSVVVSQGDSPAIYVFDESDLTSVDDGMDLIVGYNNRRWVRITSNPGELAAVEAARIAAIADVEAQGDTSVAAVVAAQATAETAVDALVTNAETAETNAETAQAAAEAARDAALAAARIYANTTAGLAAVASGEYFYVPSTDPDESLILYLDNAGVAVEVKRFPSSTAHYRWEVAAGEPDALQAANTTTTAGQVIFTDPVLVAGKPRITLYGGSAGGSHAVYSYTRSGNTYTRANLLATIAVSAAGEATAQSTVTVNAGEFLGVVVLTNGIAFRTTPTNRAARSGGWINGASGSVSFSAATVNTDKEPQMRFEIIEPILTEADREDLEDRLVTTEYEALPAVFAVGRQAAVTAESSAFGARSVIYDTPSAVGGLLRVHVFGYTAGGGCLIRRYTLSGGVYTATGKSIPIHVTANQLNVIDTGERIEAGDYLGIQFPANCICWNGSATTEAGNYYFSTGSEISYTAASPQVGSGDFALRFEAMNADASASSGTTVFLGDSFLELSSTIPRVYSSRTGYPIVNGGMGGTRLSYVTGTENANYKELSVVKVAEAIGSGSFAALTTAADNLFAATADDNRTIVATLDAVTWANVSRIVIVAGTNDFGLGTPLGTSSDAVNTTLCGAINLIDSQIRATYPNMEIFFVGQPWRSRIAAGDGKDVDTNTNGIGLYMYEYIDTIKSQAAVTKNPALDLYRTSGINKNNKTTTIPDGLHPSETTNTKLGNMIAAWVMSVS